jgi:VRR-NUC domain
VTAGAARPSDDCTHIQFQAVVVETAHLFRWSHLHVRRSIGKGRQWVTATNVKGWPDLFLWHPLNGFAALELKVGKDHATDEQLAVLASLAAAGAVTAVVYPKDWESLLSILRGSGRSARSAET